MQNECWFSESASDLLSQRSEDLLNESQKEALQRERTTFDQLAHALGELIVFWSGWLWQADIGRDAAPWLGTLSLCR
jgi:hypothetical protein